MARGQRPRWMEQDGQGSRLPSKRQLDFAFAQPPKSLQRHAKQNQGLWRRRRELHRGRHMQRKERCGFSDELQPLDRHRGPWQRVLALRVHERHVDGGTARNGHAREHLVPHGPDRWLVQQAAQERAPAKARRHHVEGHAQAGYARGLLLNRRHGRRKQDRCRDQRR